MARPKQQPNNDFDAESFEIESTEVEKSKSNTANIVVCKDLKNGGFKTFSINDFETIKKSSLAPQFEYVDTCDYDTARNIIKQGTLKKIVVEKL